MVTITFSNGDAITAQQNGNCYIIPNKIIFPDLDGVHVSGDADLGDYTYTNAQLIEPYAIDDNYWFAFREIPAEQIAAEQLRADVDYLLIITE